MLQVADGKRSGNDLLQAEVHGERVYGNVLLQAEVLQKRVPQIQLLGIVLLQSGVLRISSCRLRTKIAT